MDINKTLADWSLDKKTKTLSELGFSILSKHLHDAVFVGQIRNFEDFDFSATAPDLESIMYTALNHVYHLGIEAGEKRVQCEIKQALGIEE